MDPTEQYIAHHKQIFSLKNKIKKMHSPGPQRLVGWSFLRLIKHHIKSIVRCIIYFPVSIYQGRKFLSKTWNLRGYAKNKRALVIGNGPSQGYIKAEELDEFVKLGGDTYCVNYWNQNSKLSTHIPTWMLFSDPDTLSKKLPKSISLIEYLKNNRSIKIIVPTSQIKLIDELGLTNEIYCFIDQELSIWKNINPLFPRGYLSVTMYKALAWAVHLGYESIGVIGMDNTYARNIYNDKDNHVQRLDNVSGIDDCLIDLSSYYFNVASNIDDVVRLFYHLEYFPIKNIVNLDLYSLTDRFKKINKDDFFKDIKINS